MIRWEDFPRAKLGSIKRTSDPTAEYNCIAWALSTNKHAVWPDEYETLAWPPSLPRSESLDCFLELFKLAGYTPCPPPNNDFMRFEYVVLYSIDDRVTHASRSQHDGTWTSKLGPGIDVRHDVPETLENGTYGKVRRYVRRLRGKAYPLPELHPPPPRLITTFGAPLIR